MYFGFEIKCPVVNVFYMYNDEKLPKPNQNLFQTHDACPNNVILLCYFDLEQLCGDIAQNLIFESNRYRDDPYGTGRTTRTYHQGRRACEVFFTN